MMGKTDFSRKYDAESFNCFTFVKEVYPDLDFNAIDKGPKENMKQALEIMKEAEKKYVEVSNPKNKDIVLMNNNHIGYFQDGYVVHNSPENGGIAFDSLVKIKMAFRKVRFFRKVKEKENNDNN
jgi:hypothetical protein